MSQKSRLGHGSHGHGPHMRKLVLDNGTGYLKAGFAADNFPRVSIPAMVGRPLMRADKVAGEIELKDIMCGDEAAAAGGTASELLPQRSRLV